MKPTRRNILRVGLLLVGLVVCLLGTAYLLVRSEPSWYRAVVLSEAEQIAAQNRLVDRMATLRNEVGRSQVAAESRDEAWPAFEVEIGESEINGLLARWATTDPQIRQMLNGLKEPHVRFLPGRIELAGRSQGQVAAVDTLLSIELRVRQTPEGPLVTMGRPWAGRMPLARSLVEGPALEGLARLRAPGAAKVPAAVLDAAETLVRGEPTRPVIVLHSSLNALIETRVERLVVEDGLLKATLRPTGRGLR